MAILQRFEGNMQQPSRPRAVRHPELPARVEEKQADDCELSRRCLRWVGQSRPGGLILNWRLGRL
jgi:hypothetical protein